MTVVDARMVRADCLRVGDVHIVNGTVREVKRLDEYVQVSWSGSYIREFRPGYLFNLTGRGPAVHPAWFEEASEELADYRSHDTLHLMLQHSGTHQDFALCFRALEIQAERRKPE